MTDTKTRYPIVLIHGTGFRDRKWLNYWGRIPKVLMQNGSEIYYGDQDSWAPIEDNAIELKKRILQILEESGAEKVNLIAHSKGGLDARYLISSLGMADKIASLTTIGTPHHGSKTMDRICRLPKGLFKIGAVFINGWFRLLGDKHPNFYKVCRQFTTEYAKQFNERNPDMPGVYYQSYGAVMKHSSSDWLLSVPHFVIKRIEGDSDGMVTPASATWTNFRGVIKGSTRRGISHADEVDLRRRRFSKKTKTGHYHDICDFYLQMVKELKQSGF